MVYTRNVLIPRLISSESEFLKAKVVDAANVGRVGVHFHDNNKKVIREGERTRGLIGSPSQSEVYSLDVIVDVWSDNEGSVDDFCVYLKTIAQDPADTARMRRCTRDYENRVNKWCKAQNELKPA